MSDQLQPDLKYIKMWMQFFIEHPDTHITIDYLEEWIAYCESKERENAELKQQNTLLSGVFSREEELQSHITELKRIIAHSKEQKPIAWMTNESKSRLKHGGNVKGTVPIHTEQSNSSSIPLYLSPTNKDGMRLLGYAHRCDDYAVAIYSIKETK